MLKFLIHIVLLLLFSWSIVCGQSSNPFDIIVSEKVDTTSPPKDTMSKATKAELEKQTKEVVPVSSYLELQQEKLIGENPFNVSHLPIKSKNLPVKKEITQKNEIDSVNSGEESGVELDLEKIIENGASGKKFIFWILFIQLLLLSSLIGINRSFIGKLWRSINNDNFAKLIAREFNNGYSSSFIILYPIFLFSLSLFIFHCVNHFANTSGFRFYAVLFLFVAFVYLIRHIYHNLATTIFPFQKNINYYDYTIILFNCVLGLILIPINLTISYAPSALSILFIYIGLVVIGITYLLRYLRAILDSYMLIRNYALHFFLYLCTCEIAPVFFLVKFFSKSFVN